VSNDALSAFLDRYVGFDDDETAVAQTQLLADHPHDASQISGTFPNVSVAGDIWSTSWNGAVPADLSSVADPDATTGFYLRHLGTVRYRRVVVHCYRTGWLGAV